MPPKRKSQNNTEERKTKRPKFLLNEDAFTPASVKGVLLVTGQNDLGQLGLGEDVGEKSRLAFVQFKDNHEIIDLCAGGMHSVCLTKDGKVFTFGCNDEGTLGRVTDDEENSEFLPGLVELPGKAIQISAGDSHTVALLEKGRVFAWGTFRDTHGNMGLTVLGNEKLPYEIIKDIPIVKVASGENHIVLLSALGQVYTCGNGEQGQLGRLSERQGGRDGRGGMGKEHREKLLEPALVTIKPSLKLRFDNVWCGSCATFFKVAGKDDIYACGMNNYCQLGLKQKGQQYMPISSSMFSRKKLVQISGGVHHTIAIDSFGKCYAIGRHEYGRLGLGSITEDATELTEISSLSKVKVKSVSAGTSMSFAVTDDGKLYSWGMGSSGQLGTGNDDDCLEPTLIGGKQLEQRLVVKASSGGQHTMVLAVSNNNNEEDTK